MERSRAYGVRMDGKAVLITGAGAGIGLSTAEALADLGARIYLVTRSAAHGEAVIERIGHNGQGARLFVADLSLQSEIRRVAREILASTDRIDVLINNAGAWFHTRQVTAEGLEKTFALNHLGYFLLTNLLLERLIASAPARIISVSSDGHAEATLDFDDLQCERDYSGRIAYCRSKLANILFTRALARRVEPYHVTANCLHPGHILTGFFDSFEDLSPAELRRHGYVPAAEGAKTPVYLASSPEVEKITGCYFDGCKQARPSEAAQDDVAAERLWAESIRITGLSQRSFER